MSWNDPGGHFLAWEKWKLGWLDPSQLTCLDGPGEVTTTITPLERAGGLKAIVVPMGSRPPTSSRRASASARTRGSARTACSIYSVNSSVRSGNGPVQVHPAQRDGIDRRVNRCGPLYNAPFDSARGEVARFADDAAGLTVQVLSSSAKGYRVRVTRTSLAQQELITRSLPGPVSGESAGASAAPLSAISFPFGIGWDLDPLGGLVAPARRATRFRSTPIPSISSSTTSPRWSQRPSPCSRMQPVPTVPEPRMSPGRRRVLRAACATIASHEWCIVPLEPARALFAVHARDHLQREVAELVGRDEHRADARGEVLPLGRAEADLHLGPLEVARRPVVHDREAADLARLRRSPPRSSSS